MTNSIAMNPNSSSAIGSAARICKVKANWSSSSATDNWSAAITLDATGAMSGDVWTLTAAAHVFELTLNSTAAADIASALAATIEAAAQAERDLGELGIAAVADLKAVADGDRLYVGTLS